jgi:hypothetical protein
MLKIATRQEILGPTIVRMPLPGPRPSTATSLGSNCNRPKIANTRLLRSLKIKAGKYYGSIQSNLIGLKDTIRIGVKNIICITKRSSRCSSDADLEDLLKECYVYYLELGDI